MPAKRKKKMTYMRSTFDPRPYPLLIALRDEHAVAGPFCRHCGAPEVEHEAETKRCPSVVAPIYPPPSCACHGVKP